MIFPSRFFIFQVAIKFFIDQYLEKIKYINYNIYFSSTNNKEIIVDGKALNQMIKMSLYLIDIILQI